MHNWEAPQPWDEDEFGEVEDLSLAWNAIRLGFTFFLISTLIEAAGVFAILRILSEANFLPVTLGWSASYAVVTIFNFIRVLDRFTYRRRTN
jgi:hypothetical protein